ncbi:major facilitator superfamily domain-containing protein 6-like [Perognathus longimembris pacificus]|uniref:major facilitator superfamily domain-containing protein 6-like n=1 Tax=Perognathus longimembris pacificus TaxID=214514 RepID=UPI002018E5E5|nr:major facilitator superfamily domain-containing protein 6-like [Perognathus longimembris pacificus]
MSANPQWDVSRALGVARLFHLVCGVRDACVTPFLTLYLRQLGLAAPWVGILMGTKHLVAACWAPLCTFLARSYQKRRMLLIGSLLGSAGASLLMVLVPALDGHLRERPCNGSDSVPATALPRGAAIPGNTTSAREWSSSPPVGALGLPARRRRDAPEAPGLGNGPREDRGARPSGLRGRWVGPIEEARTSTQVPGSRTSEVRDDAWESALEVVNSALALLPLGTVPENPANLSEVEEEAQALGLSLEGLRWTFTLSLGFVVFWELLTAPLEQVADDSLYEYLDFVDATDRYRHLWIWRLLGMSAGVCGITALVGQLDCLPMTNGPRGVVHFYSYSLVSILASLVSIAFPVPISRRPEPSYKTIKALSVIGGDPRLVLLALTVFFIGAVASTVQNFLFWHMKDHGSSELIMGFSVALSLLGELLLHPFKTVLLKKLSRVGVVGLGLGCLAAQLLYYSFLWSWWSVLPVQVLGAISSGALWWGVAASIEEGATPGTERPLGTMFQGHFYGGGCSLGSFVGGFVVMRFNLVVLYRSCCVVLVLWLALFLSIQPRLPKGQKINYSKLLAVEGSDTSDSEQGSERDWLVRAMKEEHCGWKG